VLAASGIVLGVNVERRARFVQRAQDHRAMRLQHEREYVPNDPSACPMTFRSLWHERMAAKYERADRYPWLPVPPDPPMPK